MRINWKNHIILLDDADRNLVEGRSIHVDHGYVIVEWGGRRENGGQRAYLHHLVLDRPSHMTIDHRNNNGLDCRRANLRLATQSQQNQNRRKHKNRTGFKGVWANGPGFCAMIRVKGIRLYLGQHRTAEAAARAYDAAAREFFGEFARPNFCRAHKPQTKGEDL